MLVAEALPADLGGDDVGDQVVGRVGLALLHDRGQIGAHGGRRGDRHRVVVGPLVHVERPHVEPLVVLGGDPEDAGDDLDGESARDLGHQVDAGAAGQAVDEAVDGGRDELALPSCQRRGPEGVGDEVAIAAVLLAVHGQDHGAHDRSHGVGVDAAREPRGIAQHELHIRVPGHEPDVGLGPPEAAHRMVAPALRPVVVDVEAVVLPVRIGHHRPPPCVRPRHPV